MPGLDSSTQPLTCSLTFAVKVRNNQNLALLICKMESAAYLVQLSGGCNRRKDELDISYLLSIWAPFFSSCERLPYPTRGIRGGGGSQGAQRGPWRGPQAAGPSEGPGGGVPAAPRPRAPRRAPAPAHSPSLQPPPPPGHAEGPGPPRAPPRRSLWAPPARARRPLARPLCAVAPPGGAPRRARSGQEGPLLSGRAGAERSGSCVSSAERPWGRRKTPRAWCLGLCAGPAPRRRDLAQIIALSMGSLEDLMR
ncbi:basic salivary proline-rich protein 1-like [Nycticebus coucang]|uniref:basic salivary proline-rich protein 1-like n=1 Tax=Nycticebus coucang TaxID=9470 RepID=UPI00234C20B5|nr:basic salivary proline-rich protein 1-like [Nycticebus coucang]